MTLSVLDQNLLSKSRHRVDGDSVTAKFSVLTCENEDRKDEYVYWVELYDSTGDIVMKEISMEFLTANNIYFRLKETLGAEI